MFQRMKISELTSLVLEKDLLYFSHDKSDSSGVLIVFHKAVNYKITEQYVLMGGTLCSTFCWTMFPLFF